MNPGISGQDPGNAGTPCRDVTCSSHGLGCSRSAGVHDHVRYDLIGTWWIVCRILHPPICPEGAPTIAAASGTFVAGNHVKEVAVHGPPKETPGKVLDEPIDSCWRLEVPEKPEPDHRTFSDNDTPAVIEVTDTPQPKAPVDVPGSHVAFAGPSAPLPEFPATLPDSPRKSEKRPGQSMSCESLPDIPLGFSPATRESTPAPSVADTFSSCKFDKYYHKNLASKRSVCAHV